MLDVCRHKNTTQSRFCLQTCPQKRIDRPPFFDFLFLIPTQKHLWPKNLTIYHHPNTSSVASSNPLSKCPCLFRYAPILSLPLYDQRGSDQLFSTRPSIDRSFLLCIDHFQESNTVLFFGVVAVLIQPHYLPPFFYSVIFHAQNTRFERELKELVQDVEKSIFSHQEIIVKNVPVN